MSRPLVLLLLTLNAVAQAGLASAAEEFQWLLEEEYEYLEFHDPGYLVLKDSSGAMSNLDFGYTGLTYEVVETWPKGKTIRIAYSPEQGTEIIDPANNKRYSVSGKIRLDDLQESCEAAGLMPEMMAKGSCQSEALEKWDLELNRAYGAIMKGPLSEETKAAVRSAQREWLEYRDSSIVALNAWAGEVGGSGTRLSTGSSILDLTKSQTHRLRLLALE